MPEVTFYVLPSHSQQERQLFACKLTEKAYRSGQFSYILTDSEQHSRQLDDMLWSFRPGSFVPHQVYQNTLPEVGKTVLIGNSPVPDQWRRLVVNLSSMLPHPPEKCERVLEILDHSEATRQAGRNRYRDYQSAGFAITTHKM